MKILITGGSGRIGFNLIKKFIAAGNSIISVSRNTLTNYSSVNSFLIDLTDEGKTRKLVLDNKPDIIIHAAALTNVDLCETDQKLAYKENVIATKNILEISKEIGAKFVFVSSSFVFDGAGKIFKEEADPCPINYYGKTKQIGEELIKDASDNYIILRTDQPYGKLEEWQKDDNVHRVLKAFDTGKMLKEPRDWYNNPTYIDNFSDLTLKLIELNARGIYHLVGDDFINRYDWALEISNVFGKDNSRIEAINSNDLKVVAKRPVAKLSNTKIVKETGLQTCGVKEGLIKLRDS